jgi:hypothetical protein
VQFERLTKRIGNEISDRRHCPQVAGSRLACAD